jgi:hypothetical protein
MPSSFQTLSGSPCPQRGKCAVGRGGQSRWSHLKRGALTDRSLEIPIRKSRQHHQQGPRWVFGCAWDHAPALAFGPKWQKCLHLETFWKTPGPSLHIQLLSGDRKNPTACTNTATASKEWPMIASFNWLSFGGTSKRAFREEMSFRINKNDEIERLFQHYLARFPR